jgi:uncharacterized protein
VSPCLRSTTEGIELRVKVVPGASRSRIDGLYGDCLKVRVAAPPERGQANQAVIAMLAEKLGVGEAHVDVVAGHASPRKIVRITRCSEAQIASALGLISSRE